MRHTWERTKAHFSMEHTNDIMLRKETIQGKSNQVLKTNH